MAGYGGPRSVTSSSRSRASPTGSGEPSDATRGERIADASNPFSLSTPFTPRGVANVLPFGLLIYLFRLRDLLVLCDHCIAQCYLNRTASAEKPSALTRYNICLTRYSLYTQKAKPTTDTQQTNDRPKTHNDRRQGAQPSRTTKTKAKRTTKGKEQAHTPNKQPANTKHTPGTNETHTPQRQAASTRQAQEPQALYPRCRKSRRRLCAGQTPGRCRTPWGRGGVPAGAQPEGPGDGHVQRQP